MSYPALFATTWKMIRKGRQVWTLSFLYTIGTLIFSIVSFYFQKNPTDLLIVVPVLLLVEMVPWVGQLGTVVCLYLAAQGQESSDADVNAGVRSFFFRWVCIRLFLEAMVLVSSNWLSRSGTFPASMASINGILTNLAFDVGVYLLTFLGLYILISAIDGDQVLIPTALVQGVWHWIKRFGTTIGLALFFALSQVLFNLLFQSDFLGLVSRRISVILSYGWLLLSLPFIAAFILSVYFKGRGEKAPTEDPALSGKV